MRALWWLLLNQVILFRGSYVITAVCIISWNCKKFWGHVAWEYVIFCHTSSRDAEVQFSPVLWGICLNREPEPNSKKRMCRTTNQTCRTRFELSVWTELNLQFFVDILSGKKECGEVLTSVCYAGKHVGPVKWGMPVWLLFPSWLLRYPFCELSICLHSFVHACTHPYLCMHAHTVIHLQLPAPSFGHAHTALDCVEAILVCNLHCHCMCSHYSWSYGLAPPLFVCACARCCCL